MDFAIRPKSDYLKTASTASLYALTEHWKSDLMFFSNEIKFMRHLIQEHFTWLVVSGKIERIKDITNRLTTLEVEDKNLNKRVDIHLSHLEELMENSFSHDEQTFRSEHETLESDITAFYKKFRSFKEDLFEVAMTGIDKEKLRYLQNGTAKAL